MYDVATGETVKTVEQDRDFKSLNRSVGGGVGGLQARARRVRAGDHLEVGGGPGAGGLGRRRTEHAAGGRGVSVRREGVVTRGANHRSFLIHATTLATTFVKCVPASRARDSSSHAIRVKASRVSDRSSPPRSSGGRRCGVHFAMGGRGGGSGESRRAVRRVTEQLLRLALDPPEAPARADDDDGAVDDGVDVDDGGTRGLGPDALVDVAPERAASALLRALETEKYADVRAAVVAALPRVRHPARFALACVERLAARRDDVSETIGTSPGSSSAPVVQLLLESLGQACAVTAPRPAFAALDAAATRVETPSRAPPPRASSRASSATPSSISAATTSATTTPCSPLAPSRAPRRRPPRRRRRHRPRRPRRGGSHTLGTLHHLLGTPSPSRATRQARTRARVSALASRLASPPPPHSRDAFPSTSSPPPPPSTPSTTSATAPSRTPSPRVSLANDATRTSADVPADATLFGNRTPVPVRAGSLGAERAARAMRRMGLAADLPEESKLREETRLRRLCADGRWDVAERLAGEDASHRALVRRLRDDAVFGRPRESLAVFRRADASTHDSTFGTNVTDGPRAPSVGTWRWTFPRTRCVSSTTRGRFGARLRALRRERVVGVDTEWRPETCRGDAHRTALMQLAGTRTVAVLDVPKLAERCPDAFATTIREVLCETRTDDSPPVCVGFGVEDDLRRAARSYPGPVADAIASIPATVCLQTMAGRDARFAGTRAGATLSLSAATERVLGAPLDKRETTGDWERRPLTPAQMTYAALDARVLVRLFPAIAGDSARADADRDLARAEDANRDRARAEDADRDRARAEDADRDRARAYGEDEDAILRRAARVAMAFATPASAFLTADDRDAPAAFAAPSDVDGSLSRSTRRSGVASLAPLPASRAPTRASRATSERGRRSDGDSSPSGHGSFRGGHRRGVGFARRARGCGEEHRRRRRRRRIPPNPSNERREDARGRPRRLRDGREGGTRGELRGGVVGGEREGRAGDGVTSRDGSVRSSRGGGALWRLATPRAIGDAGGVRGRVRIPAGEHAAVRTEAGVRDGDGRRRACVRGRGRVPGGGSARSDVSVSPRGVGASGGGDDGARRGIHRRGDSRRGVGGEGGRDATRRRGVVHRRLGSRGAKTRRRRDEGRGRGRGRGRVGAGNG